MSGFTFIDIFPSSLVEWQPIECLTGHFQAIHNEIGKLIYAESKPSDLSADSVFSTIPIIKSHQEKADMALSN